MTKSRAFHTSGCGVRIPVEARPGRDLYSVALEARSTSGLYVEVIADCASRIADFTLARLATLPYGG